MASKKPVSKKELSTNNFIAAVTGGTVIIVIICLFVGNSVAHSVIKGTKVVAGDVKAKQQLDKKLEDIPTLIDNYNALGSKKKRIADSLPDTADFPQLVSIMQGVSTSAGVQLLGVSPETAAAGAAATAPAGGATSYSFSANISGNYASMVNFFKNLELSSRPIQVNQIQITGDSGLVTVQVNLTTYYQAKADTSDKTEVVK